MAEEERDADVAGEQRVTAAAERRALPLDLVDRVHGEGPARGRARARRRCGGGGRGRRRRCPRCRGRDSSPSRVGPPARSARRRRARPRDRAGRRAPRPSRARRGTTARGSRPAAIPHAAASSPGRPHGARRATDRRAAPAACSRGRGRCLRSRAPGRGIGRPLYRAAASRARPHRALPPRGRQARPTPFPTADRRSTRASPPPPGASPARPTAARSTRPPGWRGRARGRDRRAPCRRSAGNRRGRSRTRRRTAWRIRPLVSPVGVAAVPLERRENRIAPVRGRAEIAQRPGHSGHPEVDGVGPIVDLVRGMERPALAIVRGFRVGDDGGDRCSARSSLHSAPASGSCSPGRKSSVDAGREPTDRITVAGPWGFGANQEATRSPRLPLHPLAVVLAWINLLGRSDLSGLRNSSGASS